MYWNKLEQLDGFEYKCGYCSNKVGTDKGYKELQLKWKIYICPNCNKPTFFDDEKRQHPGTILGNEVMNITQENVKDL
ncbi:MAG: hypothetical protein ACRCXT_19410, partial [Paraclostridium sp.]